MIGSYWSVENNTCQPCPVGKYQDKVAMQECQPCEGNKTTKAAGTNTSQDCVCKYIGFSGSYRPKYRIEHYRLSYQEFESLMIILYTFTSVDSNPYIHDTIHTVYLTLVLLNPDIPCLCKQCSSRSVGF